MTQVERVNSLPPTYDGNIIFELPPRSLSTSSRARNLEGMDKRHDGHPWCKVLTTNIHNTDDLKFRKSLCAGHLACINPTCEYLKRVGRRNESKWSGSTTCPFTVGQNPPKDSTLVCKVCKSSPICLQVCQARIYYSFTENPTVSRGCYSFGKSQPSCCKKDVSRFCKQDLCLNRRGSHEKSIRHQFSHSPSS